MSGINKIDAKGRQTILKQLKAHSSPKLSEQDYRIGDQMVGETDRGAVIICASLIEDALAQRIRDNFVQLSSDETDSLFGAEAPIGSFSARIKLAYALGIIDRNHRQMCDLLRAMRNSCAHSRQMISFQDKALVDALDLLVRDLMDDKPSDLEFPNLRKLIFVWAITYLMKVIVGTPPTDALNRVQQLVDAAIKSSEEAALSEDIDDGDLPGGSPAE